MYQPSQYTIELGLPEVVEEGNNHLHCGDPWLAQWRCRLALRYNLKLLVHGGCQLTQTGLHKLNDYLISLPPTSHVINSCCYCELVAPRAQSPHSCDDLLQCSDSTISKYPKVLCYQMIFHKSPQFFIHHCTCIISWEAHGSLIVSN